MSFLLAAWRGQMKAFSLTLTIYARTYVRTYVPTLLTGAGPSMYVRTYALNQTAIAKQTTTIITHISLQEHMHAVRDRC